VNLSKYTRLPLLGALVLLLCLSEAAWGKLRLPRIFSDNMVLQRERPVPVWGWAESGEALTVAFAGQQKTATAGADGKWTVMLDPLPASREPRELTVTGAATLTVRNILVGEVWLCGGQSNMGLSLRDCFEAPREIAAADYPQFRFFSGGVSASLLPAADLQGGSWKVCSPETAANFAGTAYFFGRRLHLALNVPIGLIEFDVGATGIEGWVPLEGFQAAAEPALQEIYREVSSWNPESEIGRQAHLEAFAKIKAWLPLARQALDNHQPVPPEPLLPAPNPHQANPCQIFNGTVYPLIPYAMRGAVWYQGESNPGEGEIYFLKMKAMINGWRALWDAGDFPLYYVQLANEGKPNEDPAADGAFRYVPVREAQRRVLQLPTTGMVVAIDLGEDTSGHPRNKQDVGERLALWARAKTYGEKVPFSGPLYRGCRVEGDRMILSFDYSGSGLMVGDKTGLEPAREVKDGILGHFAIAGADGKWYWADARIVGDTVVARSDRVPDPVTVRYAYSMNPKGSKLYNREGLPASPFRTDDW